ncbi:MAG: adenine-specific DNA-methyltransferase [Parvibaculaceae bacterium]|jgi:adenine-specific DNA-methyltransferase
MARKSNKGPKQVETLTHGAATRRNIPTAELQSTAERIEEQNPFEPVVYERTHPLPKGEKRERDEDLDPQIIWKGTSIRLTKDQIAALKAGEKVELGDAQLVWRGKDNQDWSDLVVHAPPLYIQEKIHPKAIIEDLKKQTKERRDEEEGTLDLFGDFNGIDPEAKTEFYQHDQHWQNRMILGDSLQVMASLAERENLRGKVQCIYFDPPYGISFGSNWQVSTRRAKVDDGRILEITREPEQVKAFRDTWKDGVHTYFTYIRDRLTSGRDLLSPSGCMIVQIGDENVHYLRGLLDEVFGAENFVCQITVKKTHHQESKHVPSVADYLLIYAREKGRLKYRPIRPEKSLEGIDFSKFNKAIDGDLRLHPIPSEWRDNPELIPDELTPIRTDITLTQDGDSGNSQVEWNALGGKYFPGAGRHWRTHEDGRRRLAMAGRVSNGKSRPFYIEPWNDKPSAPINNIWVKSLAGAQHKVYVVQTNTRVVENAILSFSDPGDLILDPTCGSGTTATVAEQWGRRWITIDTSRVALALARTRLMSARYPYYYLSDSIDGREKEQSITGIFQPDTPKRNDIRQGFVYERAPRITLGSIANNAEIDVIWDKWQQVLEPLREQLNSAVGQKWEEWEIPREVGADWSDNAKKIHTEWWDARIKRQQEIDKSIAQKADVEYLYDRPYEDTSKVRVAGPFTVESLSPHRVIPADEGELIDDIDALEGNRPRTDAPAQDFATMVLENLKSAGVHQSDKGDRISFTAMEGWPGEYIAAQGTYEQDGAPKKAAIFIGPEFGSITRSDIMAAAREANDARFDVLIACGFNFDAHSSEVNKLGPLPILKAKMNPDLHMADDLKNTGKGNLFVVFGEPDIEWKFDDDGNVIVEVLGIDVFDPKTGEVRASGKDDIAAWFIDTDYNEESFFVRHAYFMGANDPYKALKTSLKAEIDQEAWETLYRDTSRPFARPSTGRFAVKVINHFGDEVMKVFGV